MNNMNYSKAEDFFLKAKQATEVFKEENDPFWENYKEWQILRLLIFQNLATVYKKLKNEKQGYELLKNSSKAIKSNLFLETSELILSGLDTFYLDLAQFAYKQKDYQETLFNAEISISFIRGILRNSNVLNDLYLKFRAMKKDFEGYVLKKNIMLGFLLYLKGKSQENLLNFEESRLNLIQAYNLGTVYHGKNAKITKMYEKALLNLNKRINTNPSSIEVEKQTEIKIENSSSESFEEEFQSISPFLDENNEQFENLRQKKPRRSSLYKNLSPGIFFDRKVVKHCGCIDTHEAQMAKIDYSSQKIFNKFRQCDTPDCKNHSEHNHLHNHNDSHNMFTESKEENHHHHHHGHGAEEEIFQSFCSSIINKSLNRKIKNRHLNNHDLKKIIMESEMQLKKMTDIVQKYSEKQKQDNILQKKINILYSPNHFKIHQSKLFQANKDSQQINLTFTQEKKPSVFSILTPKTPYSKRIPISRPFSARNPPVVYMEDIEENIFNDIKTENVEDLFEKSSKHAQLMMSSRPKSHRGTFKIRDETGFTTKRSVISATQNTLEKSKKQSSPDNSFLKAGKISEDNQFLSNGKFIRRKNLSRTIKMDTSSHLHKKTSIGSPLKTMSFKLQKKNSEYGSKNFFNELKGQKSIELIPVKVNENEIKLIETQEDFYENISEKSDTNEEKSLEKYEEEKQESQKENENINTNKINEEIAEKIENRPSIVIKKPMEGKESDDEEILNKSLKKKNFAEKLVKTIFENILVNRLKKKKICTEIDNEIKILPDSPIHIRDFSLFNESNSSFRGGISTKSIEHRSLAFEHSLQSPLKFYTQDLISNRTIFWELKDIELFAEDKIDSKTDNVVFCLKLTLKNSIQKGFVAFSFRISVFLQEELKQFKLLNKIWDNFLNSRGLPTKKIIKDNSRIIQYSDIHLNILNKQSTLYAENSQNLLSKQTTRNKITSEEEKLFSEKLNIYLEHCFFLSDKVVGKHWYFFKGNEEPFLKNKRNYRLYQQYLYEITTDYSECVQEEVYPLEVKPPHISFVKENFNSFINDIPSPYSLASIRGLKKESIFMKQTNFNSARPSQELSSKLTFEKQKKSALIKSCSFKNTLAILTSGDFEKSFLLQSNKPEPQDINSLIMDSVEEGFPYFMSAKHSLKPFIREFYTGIIEKILIAVFLNKGNKGWEVVKVNFFFKNNDEQECLFNYLKSDLYFKNILNNCYAEIQTTLYRTWESLSTEQIKFNDFMNKFEIEQNVFNIQHILYQFSLRRSELTHLIQKFSQKKGQEKIHVLKTLCHRRNKTYIIPKNSLIMSAEKKYFFRFDKGFLVITQKNFRFDCFLYQPFLRESHNYFSFLATNEFFNTILPFAQKCHKYIHKLWNSLISKKKTVLGKKYVFSEEKKTFKPKKQSRERVDQIHTQSLIEKLGKCFIDIEITQNNLIEGNFSLNFQISPYYSKFKKYEFSLNSEEIKKFFKLSYQFNSSNEKNDFFKQLLNDCQNFYFRTFMAERGPLYRNIRLLINEKQYLRKRKVHNNGLDVVHQSFKRINGETLIFTIARNSLLENMSITVTSSKSGRNFTCIFGKNSYKQIFFLVKENKVYSI